MQVETRPINDLFPYEKNAKLHTEEQIKHLQESLRKFGWTQPMVIDEENTILVGHGRWLAAKKAQHTHVPVVVVTGLNDLDKRALNIYDNKATLETEFDNKKLELLFNALDDAEWPMEDFGWAKPMASDEDLLPNTTNHSAIKQISILVKTDQYDQVLASLEDIQEQVKAGGLKVENHSDTVVYLLHLFLGKAPLVTYEDRNS